MIWIPIGLGLFKFTVLGTTIFLSIRSHMDDEKEAQRKQEAREQHPPTTQTGDTSEPAQKVNG